MSIINDPFFTKMFDFDKDGKLDPIEESAALEAFDEEINSAKRNNADFFNHNITDSSYYYDSDENDKTDEIDDDDDFFDDPDSDPDLIFDDPDIF